MERKKSDLPLYNGEHDERPDDTSKEDETDTAAVSQGQGRYYYDDSTGYEVYTPDGEAEVDEQSGEELIGKQNKKAGPSPAP